MKINTEKLLPKHWIYRLLFTVFLSMILTGFVSCKYFLTKAVTLEMTVTQDFNGVIQVFYQGKHNEKSQKYTEKNSLLFTGIKKDIPCKVKLNIPYYFPQMLRIDFNHNAPGNVKIENMYLRGRNTVFQNRLPVYFRSDCQIKDKTRNSLSLTTGSVDPFILIDSRKVKAARHIDLYAVGTVFSLSFLFILLIILGISKIRSKENLHFADILFIIVFLAMLFIPSLKIDKAGISHAENRTLAVFPDFLDLKTYQINSSFGSQFEKFFNDRFYGRSLMIRPYRKLLGLCNMFKRKYAGDLVLEGKDDWYFYRIEDSVKNFQNNNALPEKTMKKWLDRLVKFNSLCEKKGIKFYYYIAPDKNKVYGEYFTFVPKIKPDSESRVARWVDYIRKNSDIKVIYPLDSLLEKKTQGLLYYKNNSHWNHLGSYYGYLALGEVIKKDFPAFKLFQANDTWKEEDHFFGDLYLLAPEAVRKDLTKYKVPETLKRHLCKRGHIDEEFSNKEGVNRVLFLKDSFGALLLDYMFYSFKHIYSMHRYYFSEKELNIFSKQKDKPDMIIFEHVGRNLPRMEKFLQSTDILTEREW